MTQKHEHGAPSPSPEAQRVAREAWDEMAAAAAGGSRYQDLLFSQRTRIQNVIAARLAPILAERDLFQRDFLDAVDRNHKGQDALDEARQQRDAAEAAPPAPDFRDLADRLAEALRIVVTEHDRRCENCDEGDDDAPCTCYDGMPDGGHAKAYALLAEYAAATERKGGA